MTLTEHPAERDDRTPVLNMRSATALIAAALTINLAGGTAAVAAHGFADVPSGAYYHDAVNWLAQSGITGGCGDGNFCPDDPTTRGQMAVFLNKAAASKGKTGGAFSDVLATARSAATISEPAIGATADFIPAASATVTVPAGRGGSS